jgi:glyoxalase family protein
MVHRIVWRVGSADALDFWGTRLGERGVEAHRADDRLRFADPEGLEHELLIPETDDEPLAAEHPEIPAEFALQGFDGVRAYAADPDRSGELLAETLEFARRGQGEAGASWEARGERRGSIYAYDEPPSETGRQGAGTIHHVAWASAPKDHEAWRDRVVAAGMSPTPVIDRFYFRSVYFREPSGVLFEIATLGPGFTVDEPLESLGEKLSLPPFIEHMRGEIEAKLRPVTNPRAGISTQA